MRAVEKNRVVKNQCHWNLMVSIEVHSESGKENNCIPEYHDEYTAEEIEANYERQVLMESSEDVSCSHADREEENTDYQIEYEDNEESVPFLPADREEENTEDYQIGYKDNEESVSFSRADREEKNTEITRLNMTLKKVCHFHMLIEKKRTQKMTILNMKTMKKVSCRKWKMTFKP